MDFLKYAGIGAATFAMGGMVLPPILEQLP